MLAVGVEEWSDKEIKGSIPTRSIILTILTIVIKKTNCLTKMPEGHFQGLETIRKINKKDYFIY